jgi:hypothetical protein
MREGVRTKRSVWWPVTLDHSARSLWFVADNDGHAVKVAFVVRGCGEYSLGAVRDGHRYASGG